LLPASGGSFLASGEQPVASSYINYVTVFENETGIKKTAGKRDYPDLQSGLDR
jgi:hypothetical protein